jgi:cation diffusion facilitator family transporter
MSDTKRSLNIAMRNFVLLENNSFVMNSTHTHESRSKWVVILTAVTMIVEILFGLSTGSMALLADGIHMGSHVFAIGLSWIAYIVVRKVTVSKKYKGDPSRILALSGYTSALILLVFALVIIFETIGRIVDPVTIKFKEAIIVAITGLIVNILSAIILHHKHEDSDHNIRAAYLHVLADALTSLSAIAGLTFALLWNIPFVDALAALLSSLVIIHWSVGLLRETGKELLNLNQPATR